MQLLEREENDMIEKNSDIILGPLTVLSIYDTQTVSNEFPYELEFSKFVEIFCHIYHMLNSWSVDDLLCESIESKEE